MKNKLKSTAGFTLIEVLVAMTIFAVMMVSVSEAAVTFYSAQKRQTYLNELYEESRFLMERVVYEARMATVDYEEYFSMKPIVNDGMGATQYGRNPMEYEERFYLFYDRNDPANVHEGYFTTGKDSDPTNDDETASALEDNEQSELYLISSDGSEKTILKLIDNPDSDSSTTEHIGMTKMVVADLYDGSGASASDGLNDSWVAHPDYDTGDISEANCDANNENAEWYEDPVDSSNSFCLKFYSITPPSLEVKDFQVFISPMEDPRKAFAESGKDIQMQPHILFVVETALSADRNKMIDGIDPTLSLQTTVSSRVYNDVLFAQ